MSKSILVPRPARKIEMDFTDERPTQKYILLELVKGIFSSCKSLIKKIFEG